MKRMLITVGIAVLLVATWGAVLWLRLGTAGRAEGKHHTYGYRFERSIRGSVARALEQEIAFYSQRVGRSPDGGLDLAALASAYLRNARLTGQVHWYLLAEQAARRSLGNLPFNNNGAVLVLAKVAEARHDFTGAIRLAQSVGHHEDALSIVVTSSLALGNLNDAAKASEALVGRVPGLGSYTLRALVHIAAGKDAEALADFRRGLDAEQPGEQSTSVWARSTMGRFLMRRGRLAEARELLSEALRILPQSPQVLLYLAELETRERRLADAERRYWQVLARSPGATYPLVFDHVAMYGLARVRTLQGDPAGADILWTKAEMMIRSHLDTFGHRRELARLLLERGRQEDVIETLALAESEARTRRDVETLDTLAWALMRSARWTDARAILQEALRTGAREAPLFYRAGVIAQALGHARASQRWFRASQQLDPTFDPRTSGLEVGQ